jgi:large subunit ribosomal protein L25
VLHKSASEQILVNLTVEDLKETKLALIQDVQHNPLTGHIIHLDFHAIREDEIIHANVPLELVGDAIGVKSGGGLLEHLFHSLEIKCLPKDLPDVITADVSGLELNQSLHLRDVKMPEGVKPVADGSVIVALVSEPKVVVETAPAAAAAPAAAKGDAKGGDAKAGDAKGGDAKASAKK